MTFWSARDGTHLKTLQFPHARGVELMLDERYFAISYGSQANLALVSTTDLVPSGIDLSQTFLTGSHLINWPKRWRDLG